MFAQPVEGVQKEGIQLLLALLTDEYALDEFVDTLVPLLGADDKDIRLAAAEALGNIGEKASPAVPALVKMLESNDTNALSTAAEALGNIGEKASSAVPFLLKLLEYSNTPNNRNAPRNYPGYTHQPDAMQDAAKALGNIGETATSEAVSALVKLLESSDQSAKVQAAEALSEMGEKAAAAIPALTKLLEKEDQSAEPEGPEVDQDSLGSSGYSEVYGYSTSEFVEYDSNPDVRPSAARALGKIAENADGVIPALLKMLESGDQNTKRRAALALGSMEEKVASAVPALVQLLKSDDKNVKRSVALALGKMGEKAASAAVPPLVLLLESDNQLIKLNVAVALSNMGEKAALKAVPVLTKFLESNNAFAELNAAEALAKMEEKAAVAAVPTFVKFLKRSNSMYLWRVTYAWENMGEKAAAAVPALIERLESSNQNRDRERIAEALEKIGGKAAAAVPALTKLLESDNQNAKLSAPDSPQPYYGRPVQNPVPSAILALENIGGKAVLSVPTLIKLLESNDAAIQSAAAEALGSMGEKAVSAVPALVNLLEAEDQNPYNTKSVRASVAKALGNMGKDPTETTVSTLIKQIESNNQDNFAVEALENMGERAAEAIPTLLKLIKPLDQNKIQEATMAGYYYPGADPQNSITTAASKALGNMGEKAATEAVLALLKLLKSDNELTRRGAVSALQGMEEKAALATSTVPELIKLLESSDEYVQSSIAGILGSMGDKAYLAVPSLIKLLDSSNESTRSLAAITLGKIGQPAMIAFPKLLRASTDDGTNYIQDMEEYLDPLSCGLYFCALMQLSPSLVNLTGNSNNEYAYSNKETGEWQIQKARTLIAFKPSLKDDPSTFMLRYLGLSRSVSHTVKAWLNYQAAQDNDLSWLNAQMESNSKGIPANLDTSSEKIVPRLKFLKEILIKVRKNENARENFTPSYNSLVGMVEKLIISLASQLPVANASITCLGEVEQAMDNKDAIEKRIEYLKAQQPWRRYLVYGMWVLGAIGVYALALYVIYRRNPQKLVPLAVGVQHWGTFPFLPKKGE